MGKDNVLTKILAAAGTLLVWIPVLSPVLFSGFRLFSGRRFNFDYLLPAELFPIAMIGGGVLLWAAWRAQSRQKLIGWSLVIAVGLLVAGQATAVVTGLASGAIEPIGWQWLLVVLSLVGYTLALVFLGIGGILLLSDLSKRRHGTTSFTS